MNPYKLYANTLYNSIPFYKMKEGSFVRIFTGKGKHRYQKDTETTYILAFDRQNKEIVYLLDQDYVPKHTFEARNAGLRARTKKK